VCVGGALAGFAVYRLAAERIIFVHTEVDDEWEGKGIGSALAKGALDDVRLQNLHMTPQCPFIAAYVRRHREYVDLVDEAHRSEFQAI
jgi:predicted GNAT family acetyltransferase